MKDYYQVLAVPKDASGEQIDAAYKALAETRRLAAEDAKDIDEAYAVLSDPVKRSRYDQQLQSPAKAGEKAVRQVAATKAPAPKKPGLAPNARILLAVAIGVVLLIAIGAVVLLTRPTSAPLSGTQSAGNISVAATSVPQSAGNVSVAATSAPQSSDNASLTTTASGLMYADLVVGTGKTPAPTDWVTIHYTGTLADGSTFDASRAHGEPLTGPLDELVKAVPGWGEGISTMKVGGTRRMIIPPSLAFGDKGAGNVIPPNATITLTVDLLDTKPAPQVTSTDTVVGTGAEAKDGDMVSVSYTGKLQDGTVFTTTLPTSFQLGAGQVIPGWDKGLVGMKVGGKRTLVVPPELAFGAQGQGAIPPNALLTFEIELTDVKPAPEVTSTDTVVGTGAAAKAGDTLSVNYTGKLQDGTVFDTSVGKAPFEFQLGAGQVIPGWDKGMVGMKVGGKRTLVIPPELAYGAQGSGSTIPPNATLTFDVELLAIK